MSDPKPTTIPSEAEAELLARASLYRLMALVLADPVETPPAAEEDFTVAAAAASLRFSAQKEYGMFAVRIFRRR